MKLSLGAQVPRESDTRAPCHNSTTELRAVPTEPRPPPTHCRLPTLTSCRALRRAPPRGSGRPTHTRKPRRRTTGRHPEAAESERADGSQPTGSECGDHSRRSHAAHRPAASAGRGHRLRLDATAIRTRTTDRASMFAADRSLFSEAVHSVDSQCIYAYVALAFI